MGLVVSSPVNDIPKSSGSRVVHLAPTLVAVQGNRCLRPKKERTENWFLGRPVKDIREMIHKQICHITQMIYIYIYIYLYMIMIYAVKTLYINTLVYAYTCNDSEHKKQRKQPLSTDNKTSD